MDRIITCTPKSLHASLIEKAARRAIQINPANHVPLERLSRAVKGYVPTAEHLALLVGKRWPASGVRLTVSFLDNPPSDLRSRLLQHMNAWAARANVSFMESAASGAVRVARTEGDGYWSYLGTDIEQIAPDRPTMNLESFTMDTPDSEFYRVVRHETGHTLGFVHEHLRRELVERIDPAKAIAYFKRTQGWSADVVRQQVLTPIEEASLLGTDHADPNSIMCYQLPGEIMKDGQPIAGGADIDSMDYDMVAKIYPRQDTGAAIPPALLDASQLVQLSRTMDGSLRMTVRVAG